MNRSIFALVVTLFVTTAFAADPTNPILFVTQVPMPEEVNTRTISSSYMSCVSPFGNHLGGTAFAGRGGSLWVRFPANPNPALNHQLIDLLAVANWSAIPGGKPAANTIAVRNPCVYWDKSKAVFSMVSGAPSGPNDNTNFVWQLYEITLPTQAQLNASVQPIVSKVANQPAYNNVMPCYAPGGQFIFASDRPYNGQGHLTQREEYLGLPTVSGLWRLDAANNTLQLLHHSPSGSFSPIIDSAGRLIFVNWDHLSRDIEAVTDERDSDPNYGEPDPNTFGGWHATGNGSGNFGDESAGAAFTLGLPYGQGSHLDFFPEPRNADKKTLTLEWNNSLNGVTTNIFLPWMINLDGSGGEILNHAGRHEIAGAIKRSFNTDNNLVDLNPSIAPGYGGLVAHNFFSNLFWVREDPLQNGTFFGTDSVDLGTHGAGQIVKLTSAGANVNPDTMQVSYVTGSVTGATKPQNIPIVRVGMNITQPPSPFTPLTTPETLYRTPVPLADGALIASTATGIDQTDWNRGTISQPSTPWNFRLKSLKLQSGTYVPDVTLTNGLTITTSYFVPGVSQPVTFTNVSAWELDPAEIVARTPPVSTASTVDPIEASVFASNGVHIPTFQNYLVQQNAALSISRNVTKRDLHDRQQPYNLKIAWSNTQTTAPSPNNAPIYTVGWVQFLQADLRRGYLLGGGTPAQGRRVVATPLHDTMAENVIVPGAPPGSVRLGDDGSFAAIVPAEKALTWHLLDNDPAKTSQVKERFWVTFKKGEIRTCANCHGINTSDQSGTVANPVTKPTNPPQALATLLQSWKGTHPAGVLQHASASVSLPKSSGIATLSVTRTNGSTGPVSVDFSTANGSAVAGTDYTAANGTFSWADDVEADNHRAVEQPRCAEQQGLHGQLEQPGLCFARRPNQRDRYTHRDCRHTHSHRDGFTNRDRFTNRNRFTNRDRFANRGAFAIAWGIANAEASAIREYFVTRRSRHGQQRPDRWLHHHGDPAKESHYPRDRALLAADRCSGGPGPRTARRQRPVVGDKRQLGRQRQQAGDHRQHDPADQRQGVRDRRHPGARGLHGGAQRSQRRHRHRRSRSLRPGHDGRFEARQHLHACAGSDRQQYPDRRFYCAWTATTKRNCSRARTVPSLRWNSRRSHA